MKCQHCNQEVKKTIVINNVEYELEQHDNGKRLKDIEVPKGWRLLLPSEAMMLYEKGLIDGNFYFFVKQTNKEEESMKSVARFYAYSGSAYLSCNWVPSSTFDGLGVIFCRDLEVGR